MSKREEPDWHRRIARIVVIAATAMFALVSAWEAFGTPECGRNCTSVAFALAGSNMARWKSFVAFFHYASEIPPRELWEAHHPYGGPVVMAVLHAVFGHRLLTVRLFAMLYGVLTPLFVYRIGRALWGRLPGAAATLVFVLVPVNLALVHTISYESITIFFALAYAASTLALWESWEAQPLLFSALAAVGLAHADWTGLFFLAVVVTFGFFRGYVFPTDWFGEIDERRHAQWFAYSAAAAISSVIVYLLWFARADRLVDIVAAYRQETAGTLASMEVWLHSKPWMWLQWMVPPFALAAVAIGVPLHMVRVARKHAAAFIPVAWFVVGAGHYVMLKRGLATEVGWSHYLGVSVAFATGVVTHGLRRLVDRAIDAIPEERRDRMRIVADGSIALYVILYAMFVGIVGFGMLWQSRLTAGRLDLANENPSSDRDRAAFVAWATRRLGRSEQLGFDASFPNAPHLEYIAARPVHELGAVTPVRFDDPLRYAFVDTRVAPINELRELASAFPIQAAGPFWLVDRGQPHASVVSLTYSARKPRWLEWFWRTGSDLVYEIRAERDPWATWEWRQWIDQTPDMKLVEGLEPFEWDERRIAHNMAVTQQDLGRAREWRNAVLGELNVRKDIEFSQGLRLVGYRLDLGPIRTIDILWETTADYRPIDVDFAIYAMVTETPSFWPAPIDAGRRRVSPKGSIRAAFWKPNGLYRQLVILGDRVGEEKVIGGFIANDFSVPPYPKQGGVEVELLMLP